MGENKNNTNILLLCGMLQSTGSQSWTQLRDSTITTLLCGKHRLIYVFDLIHYLSFHNFWNMSPSSQVMGISFRAEQRQFSVKSLVYWILSTEGSESRGWQIRYDLWVIWCAAYFYKASELGVSLTFSDNWKKKKNTT